MNFTLDREQRALRDSARAYFAERWPARRMLAALDRPPATIPDDLWHEMASLGWLGLAIPEEVGGGGSDLVTAAVLIAEAGRALVPGPLVATLTAGIAIDRSGDDQHRKRVLPELCAGRTRASVAAGQPDRSWRPDAPGVTAVRDGDGWLVSEATLVVPDAASADLLLVAASIERSSLLLLVSPPTSGVTITPMSRLDGQAIAEVRLDHVRVPSDRAIDAGDAADVSAVLCAADLLGVAEHALETTITYAKQREQFGRPIGSFQAVSHRLVDCFVEVEIARGLIDGACLALTERRPEAGALASAAKAWSSGAACRATETAVQLHGGIGYTWELGLHLYVRRARANAVTAGTLEEHQDRVARWMDHATGEE